MNLKRNIALISSLMMSGVMSASGDTAPHDDARREPIPGPYFPPVKREPPPPTPEQIKAQDKRARKAAKLGERQ